MTDIDMSVAATLRSENALSTIVTLSDSALDAAVSSGALNGIPVISLIVGLWKANREISLNLYVRKIKRFLKGLAESLTQKPTHARVS